MSRWIEYNPNPSGRNTEDCAVRALAKALDLNWRNAKLLLDMYSMQMHDTEDSDPVWGAVLYDRGFRDYKVPFGRGESSLEEFAEKHPDGVYVVKLPGHVACVKDGKYYDSWDSGKAVPVYYWTACSCGECDVKG